ncbi:FAD/NAD(P)-binding protein [Nocardia brasiliensis]|uniref:FAD/NAD(P)-binding protein n=1 Tax=Nocardia brasiliensis TaxID=37326 RepID=UPI0024568D4B|nr:FAD/NAD(P)-binding protein [Nocardia brasiliensis]
MTRILQIGAGAAGLAAARAMLPTLAPHDEFVLADPSSPEQGLAFGTAHPTHLLNLPADRMSLNPDDPFEFVRWRSRAYPLWRNAVAAAPEDCWSAFPPRQLYGLYLTDVLRELTCQPAGPAHVELLPYTVTAIHPVGTRGTYVVGFSTGELELFDRVIISVGHQLNADPIPATCSLRREDVSTPYPPADLDPELCVGVLGTRLSGIDAVLALAGNGHRGPIIMVSPSGRLPSVIGAAPVTGDADSVIAPLLAQPQLTADAIADHFRPQLALPAGGPVVTDAGSFLRRELLFHDQGVPRRDQAVLSLTYPHADELWQRLTVSERHRFHDRYHSRWMARLAAFPAVSARRLLALIDSGQLQISGQFDHVSRESGGLRLQCRPARSLPKIDHLIDARGPGYSETSVRSHPLLAQLLDSGLACLDPLGGLRVVPDTFESVCPDEVVRQNLHLLGDITRGQFLTTTDVTRSVIYARRLVAAVPSIDSVTTRGVDSL